MYREAPAAPRIIELQALIDREPALREDLIKYRYEQDALVREVDELETQIGEAERAGFFGKLFGKKADAKRLQAQLDELIVKRDASIANERTARKAIESIAAARAELDALIVEHIAQLRLQEGAIGDECRGHAAEIDAATAMIAAMTEVLDACVRTQEAMYTIRECTEALNKSKDQRVVNIATLNLTGSLDAQTDVETTRSRLGSAIDYSRQQLIAMAWATEQLGRTRPDVLPLVGPVHARALAATPAKDPIEHSDLALAASTVASALDTAISKISTERRMHEARRDEHITRERELAETALRGR